VGGWLSGLVGGTKEDRAEVDRAWGWGVQRGEQSWENRGQQLEAGGHRSRREEKEQRGGVEQGGPSRGGQIRVQGG